MVEGTTGRIGWKLLVAGFWFVAGYRLQVSCYGLRVMGGELTAEIPIAIGREAEGWRIGLGFSEYFGGYSYKK
jgi:hypothetical protein